MDQFKSKQVKDDKLNRWMDTIPDNKSEEKNSLVHEFVETATVHGLRRATETRHGKFRRLFWIVIFLGMLIGVICTLVSQVRNIMSFHTITQQSLDFRGKLLFPAVTLCNLNQFRKHAVGDDERTRMTLMATSPLAYMANINWNDSIWNFTLPDGYAFDETLKHFAHPLTETLRTCTWNNKLYNCSDIFVTQKTDFGMCYTFNGVTSGDFTPRETVHSGSKYGLTVIANVQQHEYLLGATSEAAGLRVLLHDPAEAPLLEGRGFDVSPGAATKGSIKMTQVTHFPPPYRTKDNIQCSNTSAAGYVNPLRLFDRYDLSACLYECRYNYIMTVCGCCNIFDPGNDTLCHPRDILECYFPNYEKFTQEEMYKGCPCPIPCEIKLFDAEVSMSAYPSSVFVGQINEIFKLNITESEFRQNFLKLTLTYDRFIVSEIRAVPEFTFGTIMGTLGGQMGIFIGASIISLLEIVEFGFELLITKISSKRANKKISSPE